MSHPPTEMDIAAIKIGRRHRQNLGDVAGLAASIQDVGLLHPVVVTPDGTLISGARRIQAYVSLDRPKIPVTTVHLEEVARGEYAENFFRKPFAPSEWVDIARALEPTERAAAEERELAGHNQHTEPLGRFPEGSQGRAQDKVASYIGKDRKTITKAAQFATQPRPILPPTVT
jgi:ParB family chromosome partitioning protein